MVKRISHFVLLLLISASLLFPINSQITNVDVWIGIGKNIFSTVFTEPFEIFYLIFYDGIPMSITTHDKHTININAYQLRELLRKREREPKDIAIIIHNHFARHSFSQADLGFLASLRRLGFKGSFCVYVTSSKKVICKGAINGN